MDEEDKKKLILKIIEEKEKESWISFFNASTDDNTDSWQERQEKIRDCRNNILPVRLSLYFKTSFFFLKKSKKEYSSVPDVC